MLTFIYILRKGGKKQNTSESHYKKDPDKGLHHSIKGDEMSHWQVKLPKRKQNHCYLKTCNLSCSVFSFFWSSRRPLLHVRSQATVLTSLLCTHFNKELLEPWDKQHPFEIWVSAFFLVAEGRGTQLGWVCAHAKETRSTWQPQAPRTCWRLATDF